MKIGIDARFYGGSFGKGLGRIREYFNTPLNTKCCLSDDRFYNDT